MIIRSLTVASTVNEGGNGVGVTFYAGLLHHQDTILDNKETHAVSKHGERSCNI